MAGTVASVTGTAASIGVVLTALTGLGATPDQTATAVFLMLIAYGLLSIGLSWRFKMPISIVWSTPGAALLVSSASLGLGFANATGAFLVTGALLALTGLWPALGRAVSAIPKPIASAMLAGVIFPFCIAPFQAISQYSTIVLPALLVWLVLYRFAQVWAAPVAIAVAVIGIWFKLGVCVPQAQILPVFEVITPQFNPVAIIGIAIPLYLVTMASQNVPGIAIMKTFDYEVPFRPVLVSTGITTMAQSFFGGFALNLAAITAALNANEQAHKDPTKRWMASVFGGVLYLVLAFAVTPLVAFVNEVPRVLVLATAGVALFATMVNAVFSTVEVAELRLPAIVTFLIGASGLALFGVGPAFWALLGGVLIWQWLELTKSRRT
ncbi:MAG: hypothetical protein RIS80_632 [Actinomycetota bacterium]